MKLNSYKIPAASSCLSILAIAMAPAASAAEPQPVAPLLNEQTYAILALDTTRLDVNAICDNVAAWLVRKGPDALLTPDAIREGTNSLAAVRGIAEKWVQDFKQAGGRDIYAMTYAAEGLQFVIAIPMAKTGKREIIENLFEPILSQANLGVLGKEMKGDCLVLGNRETVEGLVSSKGAARSDLESALGSLDQSSVKFVLAPTPDQRRVVQEMMPAIPVGTNMIAIDALARSFSWGALGVRLEPAASVSFKIQTPTAASAQEVAATVRSLLRSAQAMHEAGEKKTPVEKAFALLDPIADQSRLTINLDEKGMEEVFCNLAGPAIIQSHDRAAAINAMNNAKQIVLACLMFQDDHKKWPEQLKLLTEKSKYLSDTSVLRNPRNPGREIGFDYLMPGKDSTKYPAAAHIVIHEVFESWPAKGLCVGFLDGHVEIMANKTRFDTLMAESKARNAGK